jgi:hypothetical protein
MIIDETKFQIKNNGSIYFGGDPWHTPTYRAFLDEIKLSSSTIQGNSLFSN